MGTHRNTALAIGVVTLIGVGVVGGVAAAGNDDKVRLRADLNGANEVPAADPDGDGRSRVELFVEDGRVCYSVRFDDTGTPHRGHIHVGTAGNNGGIVVTLFELAPPQNPTGAADPRNDELESRRRLDDCVAAPSATLGLIRDNPGNYYVNLHNLRFPLGAVRGQLVE